MLGQNAGFALFYEIEKRRWDIISERNYFEEGRKKQKKMAYSVYADIGDRVSDDTVLDRVEGKLCAICGFSGVHDAGYR